MQTHPATIIELAAIRQSELQAEAAQVRRTEQACPPSSTTWRILAAVRKRSWTAVVNTAVRLQGVTPTARGGSLTVSLARPDSLLPRDGGAS